MMNYLNINTEPLKKFKGDHPRKVKLANQLMQMSHLLRDAALHLNEIGFAEQLLLQNVFRHLQEALLLAMRGEPSMSLSMVRIAVEGCRNLLRMIEDPDLVTLFVNGPLTEEAQEKWRKIFRFDKKKEKDLFHLFNLCSDFGIHARTPILDSLALVSQHGKTNFVEVTQSDMAVEAFVRAMQAIESTNRHIATVLKHIVTEKSEASRSILNEWYVAYSATTEETNKFFDAYNKRTRSSQ